MKPKRVAFVTPEYPGGSSLGGLANYVRRMARALRQAGHEAEVFVPGAPAGVERDDGIRIERTGRVEERLALRAWLRLCRTLPSSDLGPAAVAFFEARRLAKALRRRERKIPFDLVQSSDFRAAGLFVPHSAERPHLVRCSADAEALAAVHGLAPEQVRWRRRLERAAIRRADRAYAPSRWVAERLGARLGRDVAVLRPPIFLEVEPASAPPTPLPRRFLLHFGQLCAAKGTPGLARALPLVWKEEPEFHLVLAGPDKAGALPAWRREWGRYARQVPWLGELDKPALYAVLARAEAAVLPSLVDNLPNTALESLLLGVPVIGSRGASLDELVEPGVTGELVPPGDAEALAAAMLRAWWGRSPARKGFRFTGPLADSMRPEAAVHGLLALAGLAED